jgi:general secretion pathway protein C
MQQMQPRTSLAPRQGWSQRWLPRLAAFVLSAVATASIAFWALKWPLSQPRTDTSQLSLPGSQIGSANPQASGRLMGALQPNLPGDAPPTRSMQAVNAASRLHLAGVVSTHREAGMALIAIDGKPARPFAVGTVVDGNLRLLGVTRTQASLGPALDAPASLVLQLPQQPGQKPGPS